VAVSEERFSGHLDIKLEPSRSKGQDNSWGKSAIT